MSFQYSPYATPLFLAAVMTTALAWYALRQRQRSEALIFGVMMIALSLWSLFYALSISGADLETQHLFNRLKYIGVMAVPPLWLILALQYTQRQSALTRRNLVLIFLPAMLLLPVVLTDHLTHLWWPKIWLGEFGGLPVLEHTHGAPYYAHVAFSYLCIIWGLWLYVGLYLHTERIYRSQAGLMIVAAAIPLVASILTQVGLSPLPWGLDSFFFTLSGVLIAIAIFRYRFLDIMPVAWQAIVEQIPEGVIVIDARGRIVDANPAAQAMLRADKEPIVGQPLAAAVHIPELRQALLEITQRGRDQPDERDVYLDGRDDRRVLSLSTAPLSHGVASPIGQIILLRDISERVAAQKELEALYQQAEVERERLALTISTASDAIALLDANGEILASNPSARLILQTEQSDQFLPALQAVLDQAQAAAEVTKAEIKIGEQSFHVAAAPVAGTGLVLTMHDVTHFKQLARLKDEFVSTVSHDLRTPLTSILGYAQIARLEAAPEDALKRIETAAQRMSDLVKDLLDLATLEADIEHESVPVELDKLARVAIEDMEGAALAKGLAIQRDLNVHPPVKADPRLIAQMWRNLIDNAIKYTEKGTITIRVKAVGNQIVGQVADTGVGIAPADIPYVFDKFFRAKHPYMQEISGTGLGLSLVKSIVEKHGGQIWAESELGVGSTFTLTLPLHANQNQTNMVE
jgi:PAS domain S-box-containing protein